MLSSMRYSMLKANSELLNLGCEGKWLSVSKEHMDYELHVLGIARP